MPSPIDTLHHDLSAGEVAWLASRCRDGISRWKWIRIDDTRRIEQPELRMEGGAVVSATATSEATPAEIVKAIYTAHQRRHTRRSDSSKRAAATRAARHEARLYEIAQRVRERITRRDTSCRLCGRTLSDPDSIARGIGSECWQEILRCLEATS